MAIQNHGKTKATRERMLTPFISRKELLQLLLNCEAGDCHTVRMALEYLFKNK